MRLFRDRAAHRARTIAIAFGLAGVMLVFAGNALATNPPTVLLQTADSFALIAGATITDVPTSTIHGDVGLSPAAGSAITGMTCAEVTGTIYTVDATGPLPCRVTNPGLLTTATAAVTAAYVDAKGRTPDATFAGPDNQLGGQSLVPGVYAFGHAATANLIGNLTLAGDADSVWIFQASSDFVTAASSTVTLTGGAQACNVFWKVESAATLGTSSTLVGTVLAHDDISVTSAVTVQGRLLAGAQASGAITLISDTITRPSTCFTVAQLTAAANAAAAAAAAATAASNAAAAAQAAAAAAAQAAVVAQAAAVVKAAEDAKVAAAAAVKAAAAAKTAAAVAAKAAAAADAKTAKTAAAKAVKAAKVAAAKAAAAKNAAAKARAHAISTRNLARPARRHVGLTG